jgi:DNA-binding GntR family transcriptional regulator
MSPTDSEQKRQEPMGEAGGGRAAWAYEMLHDAIREGTIEPGQRLMELDVSAWLKMSRTPVREAMRRLQAEGMLEHAAGGGMSVVLYDLRAIDEFYAMRESLEGTAAALAAKNADETEIRILSATLDAMRALPHDARAHARENQVFHEQIYRAARNRFLLKSLQSLLNFVPLLGPTTYNAPGRIEHALEEHVAIVDAIRARDPARAEDAIRQHIRHSHESRILVVSDSVRNAVQRRSERPQGVGLSKARGSAP